MAEEIRAGSDRNRDSSPENGGDQAPREPQKTPVQEIVDEILAGLPQWLREPLANNFRQIFAGIACILLVAALWSGYTGFVERGENAASARLGTAIHTADPKARMELLEKVIQEHGRTDAAEHALLLLGAAARDAGDVDASSEYFSRALQTFSDRTALHDSALMGLGYCMEEKGNTADAAERFRKAADNAAGYETVALLDLARVSAAHGKTREALQAYEKFMAAAPMSPQLDFVRFEIMKLSEGTDKAGEAAELPAEVKSEKSGS